MQDLTWGGNFKMKNSKLLLIPAVMILSIFLLAAVQASVLVFIVYEDTSEYNLTINNGDSFGLSFSASSLGESQMNIVVDFLDSSGNVMANMWNVQTTWDSYSDYSVFNQLLYSAPGNYTIRAIVTGSSGQSDTETLSLEVLAPTAGNNPPIITSTPTTNINEEANYIYQIVANDADNDALTYSLTQGPSWLSVDANGLVTGTAPDVNGDYSYAITAEVSDGQDFGRQTYSLLVRDLDTPDTTAPFITVVSPADGGNYSNNVLFSITTNEDTNRAELQFCGLINPVTGGCDILAAIIDLNQTSPTSFGDVINLSDGTYTFAFRARDLAGNYGITNWMIITVNSSIPDTTAPVVTIISPADGSIYDTNQITVVHTETDTNLDWCAYELNGMFYYTINCNDPFTITTSEGTNTLTVYAIDTSFNVGSATVTFTVDFGEESKRNHKSRHVSNTDDEEQYFSQFNTLTASEDEEILLLGKQPSLSNVWALWLTAGVLVLIVALIILWIKR